MENDTPDELFPLMTWHARPDMSCEYVNRSWLEYTGYTLEQAMGEGWSRCLHPEDLARWLDACVRAFDARAPFEIEYRLRRRDGEYRWVLDRAAPRFSGNGALLGYAGVCVDIDEHRRVEDGLARALASERRLRLAQNRIFTDLVSDLLDLSGVQVLMLDQACDARDALVRLLEVAGAEVRVAANPAQALETLRSWRPDVLLSGANEPVLRAAALSAGLSVELAKACDAQLARPVEPMTLLATVARLAA
jgi:PAS domain S-box-containing protein